MDKPIWLRKQFGHFSNGKTDARGVLTAFREAVNDKIITQRLLEEEKLKFYP